MALPGMTSQRFNQSTITANTPGVGATTANSLKQLGDLFGAGEQFLTTYRDAVFERVARDANTETENLFRQQEIDQKATRKGKAADFILDDNMEWSRKQRARFDKDYAQLPKAVRDDLWAKNSSSFFNRLRTYQLEQAAQADKDSKFAALDSARQSMVGTDTGDWSAFEDFSSRVDQIYEPNTKDNIEAKLKGFEDQVFDWAAADPHGTKQWFDNNVEEIRGKVGTKFPVLRRAVDAAYNRVKEKAQLAELQEARLIRAQTTIQNATNKALVTKSLVEYGDYLMALQNGDAEGILNYDTNAVERNIVANGGDAEAVLQYRKVVSKETDKLDKRNTQLFKNRYLTAGLRGELTGDQIDTMNRLAAEGKMNATDVAAAIKAQEWAEKPGNKIVLQDFKRAENWAKSQLAPSKGALGAQDPAALNVFHKTMADLQGYVDSLPDLKAKREALDILNPDSIVSRLVQGNLADTKDIGGATRRVIYGTPKGGREYNPLSTGTAKEQGLTPDEYLKQRGLD